MNHEGMGRRPSKGGDEYDVYTGWRKVLVWTQRPGAVKKVKKRTHRRSRREHRQRLRDELD